MERSWRDIVAELAGPNAEMRETTAHRIFPGEVAAQLPMPGTLFRIPRDGRRGVGGP